MLHSSHPSTARPSPPESGAEISAGSPSRLSPACALRWGANALIAGLWLWLYRPVFDYLAVIFSRDDFRANQVALAGVLGLAAAVLAWYIHTARRAPRRTAE